MNIRQTIDRRGFLQWSFRTSGVMLWGGLMQGLASCGASSESFQSGDLPVLDKPSSVTISIEARQVQWVPGVPPARDNAWVYVAHGATAASGVLPNHLGATFEARPAASPGPMPSPQRRAVLNCC
jgi:hypothetical protein